MRLRGQTAVCADRRTAGRVTLLDVGHAALLAVGGILTALALVILWGELRLLRHDVLPALVPEDQDSDEAAPPAAQI